jgi:hypothetical protein
MRCSVQPQHEIAALELSRRLAPQCCVAAGSL